MMTRSKLGLIFVSSIDDNDVFVAFLLSTPRSFTAKPLVPVTAERATLLKLLTHRLLLLPKPSYLPT
jgi:hypothetical protein